VTRSPDASRGTAARALWTDTRDPGRQEHPIELPQFRHL
jgi:hypothetical protein